MAGGRKLDSLEPISHRAFGMGNLSVLSTGQPVEGRLSGEAGGKFETDGWLASDISRVEIGSSGDRLLERGSD